MKIYLCMNRDKNELDLRVLCVRLKECLELLQNDALRINCARKARSIQKWEAVVNCGIACEKVIQAMESNDLNRVGANIPECTGMQEMYFILLCK